MGGVMKIIMHNVFEPWTLESKSAQLICTSPPYFALRKYDIPDVIIGGDKNCRHDFTDVSTIGQTGGNCGRHVQNGDNKHGQATRFEHYSSSCSICGAWKGQYGLERTHLDYIEHTRLWCQEAWRVLKDDGVFFLNIADTYHGSWKGEGSDNTGKFGIPIESFPRGSNFQGKHYKDKCKYMIPERVAIALIDDGWILRNHIIWAAPNKMPESTQDRFSKKYESIFMFVKSNRYYFDLDAVRMPHKYSSIERLKRAVSNENKWVNGPAGQSPHGLSQPGPNVNKYDRLACERSTKIDKEDAENHGSPRARYHRENYKGGGSIGREQNLSISTHEFGGGDYLVANLNEKGKNPGDVWNPPIDDTESDIWSIPTQPLSEKHYAAWPQSLVKRMILCATKEDDTVLDPFVGSGTTGRVAIELRRNFIGFDLAYEDIQKRRTSNVQVNLI
jgi:site-specific DNA-methyltransferase (cytosine-N4-specific)